MIFKWETEEERIRRYMQISPKKKLEWLQQMKEFMAKCSPPVSIASQKKRSRKSC